MYNISIQRLKTWQRCNTLQACEKERTHAKGLGIPNGINSHKIFNITFLHNTFYLLIRFRHVLTFTVSHRQGDLLHICSLCFKLYILEIQHIIKIYCWYIYCVQTSMFQSFFKWITFFGSRRPVSWVHAMNEYAIWTLYTSYSCTENVKR